MKRWLIVFVCILIANPAFGLGRIRPWGNVNSTGDQVVTAVPTDLIRPGYHKIIGLTVVDLSGANSYAFGYNNECFVSLEDIINDDGIDYAEIIVEAEFGSGGGSEWFTYPITVTTQLKVHQGAYTEVQVHYAH